MVTESIELLSDVTITSTITIGIEKDERPKEKIHYQEVGMPSVGPCLFRVLLGIAETYTGRYLAEAEILQARTELSLKKVATTRGVKPVVDIPDDYYVWDYLAVINWTLSKLCSPTKAVESSRGEAQASALYGKLLDGNGYHWVEGNGRGVFMWDPSSQARSNYPFVSTKKTLYFKFVSEGVSE